jgi:hypothetical protein
MFGFQSECWKAFVIIFKEEALDLFRNAISIQAAAACTATIG